MLMSSLYIPQHLLKPSHLEGGVQDLHVQLAPPGKLKRPRRNPRQDVEGLEVSGVGFRVYCTAPAGAKDREY